MKSAHLRGWSIRQWYTFRQKAKGKVQWEGQRDFCDVFPYLVIPNLTVLNKVQEWQHDADLSKKHVSTALSTLQNVWNMQIYRRGNGSPFKERNLPLGTIRIFLSSNIVSRKTCNAAVDKIKQKDNVKETLKAHGKSKPSHRVNFPRRRAVNRLMNHSPNNSRSNTKTDDVGEWIKLASHRWTTLARPACDSPEYQPKNQYEVSTSLPPSTPAFRNPPVHDIKQQCSRQQQNGCIEVPNIRGGHILQGRENGGWPTTGMIKEKETKIRIGT